MVNTLWLLLLFIIMILVRGIMMQKKKGIQIIEWGLLLVVVLIIMFFGWMQFSKQKQEDELYFSKTEEGDITRYEWISLLAEQYGLTDYSEKKPYFEDVTSDDAHFAEVQSAVEWKVLKIETAFEGEQYVSGRFAALTAMRVVGQTKLKMYAKTSKELDDKDLLDIAIEEGLITEVGLTVGVSRAQSEEMLEHLHELYYGKFSPKDYLDISFQKDVILLDSADVSVAAEQENTIIVAEDAVKNLREEAIIIYEDNIGAKQAGKIKHVQSDGVIVLESVRPEQFLESFMASGQQRVDFDDMVTYCQLSDDQLETHDTTTENMRYEKGNDAAIITGNASIEGFSLALESVEDEEDGSKYLQVILTNGNGLSYVFREENAKRLELEDDEDIKAELSVNRLEVLGQTDYQLLQGWNYAEVALNMDTVMSGVVSLSEEEKMLLAEIPVPMAGGTVKINVQIYLVIGMDGSIELRAEMPLQGEVRYEKGIGFRKASFDMNVEEPSLQADCRLDLALRGEPVLSVFGCDILDAEADVGMCTETSTVIRATGQQCMDISSGYPIVTLAVLEDEDAETLLSELISGKSWDIITKEQTLFKLYMHFEQLNDGTRQFVDECTYREEEKAEIIDAVLNGDFSEFAGSYKATERCNDMYGGGQPLANLELHEDGSVSGGGSWYSPEPYASLKPKSITKNDDGSYLCVITDEGDVIENKYYIYPEGIVEERVSDEKYLVDAVYIRIIQVDGGVSDIIFYKDNETDKSKSDNRSGI